MKCNNIFFDSWVSVIMLLFVVFDFYIFLEYYRIKWKGRWYKY